MKIKDLMTTDVIFVYSNTSILEVADILFKNRFHGVPVVEGNKLVGIITESDFFLKEFDDLYLPSYVQFIKENKIADNMPKEFEAKISQLFNLKAKDLMTKDCLTVSPEQDAQEMMKIIKKTNFYTFPVTDINKNLLGIVTLSDILGTVKKGSQEMKAVINSRKERPVDELVKATYMLWRQKFVLVSRKRIRTWEGMAFVSALTLVLLIAFFWLTKGVNLSDNFDNRAIVPVECQSFEYTQWSACRADNTQVRQVIERLPKNCEGGIPKLIQNCQ